MIFSFIFQVLCKEVKYPILGFMLLFSNVASGQYFDNGQDPGNIRWRTLSSVYFDIIYPDYFEKEAQKIAITADSLFPVIKAEMNYKEVNKMPKLPLILHTRSSYSNAFLAWAPRRMEWYTCTPQNTYAQPWYEQLAIHESRHEMQLQVLNQGPSGFLTSLLGEHIIGATIALFIPQWFMEGDAVWAETTLSNTGRGHDGDFAALNKAQLVEKGIYSYDKAIFGSYTDFVPNAYNMGYYLIAYSNEQIMPNYWQKVLQRVSKLETLRPFHADGNRQKIYDEAMNYWKNKWTLDTIQKEQHSQTLTARSKVYTLYASPFYTNDTSIISLKSSYNKITHLVSISQNKKEKKIKSIGNVYDNYMDYNKGQLTWVETIPDKRWDAIKYTDLIFYDLNTHVRKKITHKKNLFTPSFSLNGSKIAAIQMDSLSKYQWVIFNTKEGLLVNQSTKSYDFISFPVLGNDDELFVIELNTEGKRIQKIDINNESTTTILPYTYSNLRNLKWFNQCLYFVSDQSGTSQIYSFNIQNQTFYQITDSKFGVGEFSFSSDKKVVLYTNYTSNGYEIQKTALEHKDLAEYKSNGKSDPVILNDSIEKNIFPSKTYSKWKHLFNFHSWAPIGIPTVSSSIDVINPGITLMSQNIMSTSFLNFGYMYNQNESASQLFTNYTYKGFYPILSTTLLFQQRHYLSNEKMYSWNELRPRFSIQLPFSFSRSNHYYGFALNGNYEYVGTSSQLIQSSQYIGSDLIFIHSLKKAYAQIQPRWRQNIIFSIRKELTGSNALFAAKGSFNFPGFAYTHSFNLYTGFQAKKGNDWLLTNLINIARGYQNFESGRNLLSGQVNYTLPLFYPEVGIPGVIYCKRIVSNLFFDGMNTIIDKQFYYSTGIELYGNWHILRFDYSISLGIRCAALPQTNKLAWNIIFSVDL